MSAAARDFVNQPRGCRGGRPIPFLFAQLPQHGPLHSQDTGVRAEHRNVGSGSGGWRFCSSGCPPAPPRPAPPATTAPPQPTPSLNLRLPWSPSLTHLGSASHPNSLHACFYPTALPTPTSIPISTGACHPGTPPPNSTHPLPRSSLPSARLSGGCVCG